MRGHINEQELILSWDNELSRQRQSDVTRHVESCVLCREKADRLRSTMQSVTTLYRSTIDTSSVPLDFGRMRLESALTDAATAPSSWSATLSAFEGLSVFRGLAMAVVAIALGATAFVALRGAGGAAFGTLSRGTLPDSSMTPGAVSQLTTAELCNGVRPSRFVAESVRQQVLHAYGMQTVPPDAYELDALITPELGGSTDPANLWPQRYQSPTWNAKVKDELERLLPELVCSQQITLADAQREIASDWVAAYKRHFKTDTPLRAHLDSADEEGPELVFVSDEPASGQVASIRLASR